MARGRGAVSAAVASGSSAENVDAGLSELIGLAERSGPPNVPRNLGNFDPERGVRPARGSSRAAARSPQEERAPQRATVTRIRNERLQSFDDERAETAARREIGGAQVHDVDDGGFDQDDDVDQQPLEDLEPARGVRTARPEIEDDVDDVDPRDRELHELRSWRAEQDQREQLRDAKLEGVLAAMRGGQTAPAAAPAADARVQAVTKSLAYGNISIARIDEQTRATLGLTEQGARVLETLIEANLHGTVQKIVQAYALDQELTRAQQTQVQAADSGMRDVTAAFWQANPGLQDYQEEVNWISAEIARQHPEVKGNPALWIKATTTAVTNHLARRGIRVGRAQPQQTRQHDEEIGAYDQAPRRVRPATMDMPGSGGGFGGGRRLTPTQKDILDLVAFS